MDFANPYDEALARQPFSEPFHAFDLNHHPWDDHLFHDGAEYLGLVLSTPTLEREISRWLAAKYNVNSSTYDRAIDAVYNQTHIGGPHIHHNLDGSHTWAGAIQTLQDAFPEDSDFQRAFHALVHLANDCTTPSGINPFLNPHEFEVCKTFLIESFHLPRSLANDLLNINAAELVGAAVATTALLLGLSEHQLDTLGEYVGRLTFASYFAGNPVLFFLTAIALGYVCYRLWSSESVGEAVQGMLLGGVSGATFFAVATQLSGPVVSIVLGVMAAAAACYAVSWVYQQVRRSLQDDLDQILTAQFAGYRSYDQLMR